MKKKTELLTLKKEFKSKTGIVRIWINNKTKQHHWSVISRNGYIVSSAKGLDTIVSCMKGIRSTKKVLSGCIK